MFGWIVCTMGRKDTAVAEQRVIIKIHITKVQLQYRLD